MNAAVFNEAEIDKLARAMAARAGLVWEQLNSYPGYERNRWRGEAQRVLKSIQAGDAPRLH
jgi:hypothetical protein